MIFPTGIPLQWGFFEYLPVVLQDAATKDVLMLQYMTEEGLRRTQARRSPRRCSRRTGGGGIQPGDSWYEPEQARVSVPLPAGLVRIV
jgi:hypothetical protein